MLVHSYPPSPPAPSVVVQPPSPTSIHAKLEEISSSPSSRATISGARQLPSQITQFILAPHSSAHVPQPETSSFFTRALSAFRNSKPSHSSSFTLCPLPPPAMASTVTSVQNAPTAGTATPPPSSHHFHLLPRPIPLLTFHDRTPILTVGSITGLLEIDEAEQKLLGVQTSFWIAVALTYLGFLEERDVSTCPLSFCIVLTY